MRRAAPEIKKVDPHDDVRIHTQRRRCQAEGGLRGHRVSGVVVALEGNAGSSSGSHEVLVRKAWLPCP